MSAQFIHVESYSRQNPKNVQRFTATDIAAEAMRDPGYCNHVKNPKSPQLIFGTSNIHDVVRLADQRASVATDRVGRKFRKDGLVLLAGVVSISRDLEIDRAAWVEANVEYLRQRFGNGLQSVIAHNDEAHPHLHFFVVPEIDAAGRFSIHSVHPGEAARARLPEKAGKGAKNRAFKEAMKAFQDDYYLMVSSQFGMGRVGPRRERKTRQDYIEARRLRELEADRATKNKQLAAELSRQKGEFEGSKGMFIDQAEEIAAEIKCQREKNALERQQNEDRQRELTQRLGGVARQEALLLNALQKEGIPSAQAAGQALAHRFDAMQQRISEQHKIIGQLTKNNRQLIWLYARAKRLLIRYRVFKRATRQAFVSLSSENLSLNGLVDRFRTYTKALLRGEKRLPHPDAPPSEAGQDRRH